MHPRLFGSFLGIVTAALLTRCGMPGNVLGIYSVSGTMQQNTCGAGLQAPSPWNFNVELSNQTGTLFWNTMDGNPLLSGTIEGTSVSMATSTSGPVDETADGGVGPCTMSRNDSLALSLDSSSAPTKFTGTLTYAFSVVAGSDCSDQMSAQGGMYDTLPCTVSYSLSGAYSGPGQ